MGTSATLTQPFTFTGREYDPETGLYFYRARYYDAKGGRFISEDPIGLKGGINKFAYVKNNSVNKRDPFGLLYCDELGCIPDPGSDPDNWHPMDPGQAAAALANEISEELRPVIGAEMINEGIKMIAHDANIALDFFNKDVLKKMMEMILGKQVEACPNK